MVQCLVLLRCPLLRLLLVLLLLLALHWVVVVVLLLGWVLALREGLGVWGAWGGGGAEGGFSRPPVFSHMQSVHVRDDLCSTGSESVNSCSDTVSNSLVERSRKVRFEEHGGEQVCRADRRYVASPGCWNISTVCRRSARSEADLAETLGSVLCR